MPGADMPQPGQPGSMNDTPPSAPADDSMPPQPDAGASYGNQPFGPPQQ